MYGQKIGISVGNHYDRPLEEVIGLLGETGFEAISPVWEGEKLLEQAVRGSRFAGLQIQSLHAPFSRAAKLWRREEGIAVAEELLECVDACARHGIGVLVLHVWIGFDYRFDPQALYYGHLERLVDEARRKGVLLAFENTEGEEYLFDLMERFAGEDGVGFCWDSGHELCYNRSRDLLSLFGDRLIMTHLNDNLGISRFDGRIFWTDDLHLLPYDGIADWQGIVQRLARAKPQEILNFELNQSSKPHRHENDGYAALPLEQFFALAYGRACRIAHAYLFQREEGKK